MFTYLLAQLFRWTKLLRAQKARRMFSGEVTVKENRFLKMLRNETVKYSPMYIVS